MAEKKEICLTFLYADEGIFDYMNSEGRLTKMIDWADQFFGQYDLKLNIHPTTFNIKKYKEDYTYTKSNGPEYTIFPMAPSAIFVGLDFIFDTLISLIIRLISECFDKIDLENASESPKESYVAEQTQLRDVLYAILAKITAIKTTINKAESAPTMKIVNTWKVDLDRSRVPVFFLNFIDVSKIFGGDIEVIGITATNHELKKTMDELESYQLLPSQLIKQIYAKTEFRHLIVMDPRESSESLRTGTLAHEIAHCAYGSTSDDEGGKDSIMNYKDLFANAKTPTKLKLDKDDVAKLKTAYFVK